MGIKALPGAAESPRDFWHHTETTTFQLEMSITLVGFLVYSASHVCSLRLFFETAKREKAKQKPSLASLMVLSIALHPMLQVDHNGDQGGLTSI